MTSPHARIGEVSVDGYEKVVRISDPEIGMNGFMERQS